MRPVYKRHTAQLCRNGCFHGLVVGAGHAYRGALFYTGCQQNGVRPSVGQHFGAGHGSFAGASAAADKAYDFRRAEFLKGQLSGGSGFKIHSAGAHVFCLLAPDDAYFFHRSLHIVYSGACPVLLIVIFVSAFGVQQGQNFLRQLVYFRLYGSDLFVHILPFLFKRGGLLAELVVHGVAEPGVDGRQMLVPGRKKLDPGRFKGVFRRRIDPPQLQGRESVLSVCIVAPCVLFSWRTGKPLSSDVQK